MNFYSEFIRELLLASKNNYSHRENYDHTRFGLVAESPATFKSNIRKKLEKVFESSGYSVVQNDNGFDQLVTDKLKTFEPYFGAFEHLYNILSHDSRELLLKVLAFRVLGFTKVKLPVNTPELWAGIQKIEELADKNEYVETKFMNWHLPLIDLNKKGVPVKLYFLPVGVYTDFFMKQYAFSNGTTTIKAEKGDYVIDAGGCWGDTALYFSYEVGETGKVFTYEFIPSNLEIFDKNISLNPELKKRIVLVPRPVWTTSNNTMYYIDNGPGSRVFMEEESRYDGKVLSLSIDDLVAENAIAKVDFIKMDIEGAEPYALKGAIETIKKFKPKLAIAIYHSLDDFVNIPKFIHELGLGYELHLAHCSIHEEESILFAEIPAT